MQAFLEQVVKGLVDHPDAVNITEVEQERTTVYELRLDPSDVGRVIGRSGRTVNACLLYTSPSPRDATLSRMPSSA